MVTRNQKAWADSAVKLLEWSRVGTHNTVNQYALPALIIILNGRAVENEAWISDDKDAATRDSFMTIENEIKENNTLREMAMKHGDKSMKDLLLRNFSSVHVHYVPLEGYRSLERSGVIVPKINRLAKQIRKDAERVQVQRRDTSTRFDANQLKLVFDYAFKHLASGSDDPFDFNQCRHQISPPNSIEGHFAEFLGQCLQHSTETNFDAAAAIVGSCLVRNSLKSDSSGLLHPLTVFSQELKGACHQAIDEFLKDSQRCSYAHPYTGTECINTRNGHALGHQSAAGDFLAEGNFVDGVFNTSRFLGLIDDTVIRILKAMTEHTDPDREIRRQYATREHRSLLGAIPDRTFWSPASFNPGWMVLYNLRYKASLSRKASVCYACLFDRPEYTLPCGHIICFKCLREFDESSPSERYPGIAIHKSCVLCSSSECGTEQSQEWPYKMEYLPTASGIRVLSLDGGGVRAIIELSILKRLERLIGLNMHIGGLVALGLGVHNLNVDECVFRFKAFCQAGFHARTLAKKSFVGWIIRLIAPAIYETEPLEDAFKAMFRPTSQTSFGHHGNTSKVAITTTVHESGRCTSAAPMYFEPFRLDGMECRDGGLRENNPAHIAMTEAKSIWGANAVFDMILSIGSGRAKRPQRAPSAIFVVANWLLDLFQILIETMNGEVAWVRFYQGIAGRLSNRCHRLNITLPGETEPDLDDVNKVDEMEKMANEAPLFNSNNNWNRKRDFATISGNASSDLLKVLADSLKASLYFFEIDSFKQQADVSIIKGWICCRLHPDRESFKQLAKETSYFQVKNTRYDMPILQNGERLKMDVSILQQERQGSEPIRIDVQFKEHLITISGFPTTLDVRFKSLPG
ncbi:MAG: hypothetical protein Q9160_006201 [Pyrenula sp. 1 TL-2023]